MARQLSNPLTRLAEAFNQHEIGDWRLVSVDQMTYELTDGTSVAASVALETPTMLVLRQADQLPIRFIADFSESLLSRLLRIVQQAGMTS